VISAAERYEDRFREKLAALEQLKQSLMHDLLAGKVRVGDPCLDSDA
jgi:hypothetical protein